ncbi:TRAP transporter small permease [Pseudodonghicola flavimaris]|uniref:TRAP transporter small permease protein n=1 Tax=Pseudodonghicola flavimaris TaxID=3050036 RepID=A0ABT7EWZ5_9RHOB|nr:TRAP transporter small permease [Pseudodonghicola flavimaris]MDK3016866.1 TRAP transporter small permease [Pseudodonghicola flavimaris]
MHKVMMGLARGMAVAGGVVLSALIVLTCLSIAGRLLNGAFHSSLMQGIAPGLSRWMLDLGVGPINGDFELVEAGVAFAIFAFIPLCQISSGHASVDVLANMLPRGVNRFLRMVTEALFAAVLVLIAWKLFDGMMSKKSYGETSFLLQFPVWWAYGASLIGAVMAAVVGVYMAVVRIIEFLTGRIRIWDGVETDQ